ncbi:hypothetical protein SAE02_76790 [Skermanella aerolata]|uniref:Cation-transporting P-type ATPase N-terminal domain-containing protein n=1 Tax=Skermanella aerolata TaxID=393310 RepID=A0A512E491_9PROT|nr:cation-transporting P-type ATPase [Skermanella aerolata]KJB91382.1 hypothetical protein N826_30525 [Skermanella aerolata KACC 11604]GEO43531.1 hypothetical protein SAE02_76790 [Skermanella aerolata]
MDRHSDAPWHTLTPEEAIERQATDPEHGLLEVTAHARRARYGPNELVEHGGRSLWRILWDQVASVMILVLLVAAGFAAALGKPVDAGAILAIVALFVVLGAVQEYRARSAITALRRMAAPSVRVIRGGVVRKLPARDLVPGDLLQLETGDVVPADARIVDSIGLRLQEAALTGESEPVEKIADALPEYDLPLGDRVKHGLQRHLGDLRAWPGHRGGHRHGHRVRPHITLIEGVRRAATPLQRRLDTLSRTFAAVTLVIALAVAGSGLWRGEDLTLMLLVGVSLAVAIVPEGLPAVLTATLALGGRRMLRRRTLICTCHG